MATKFEKLDKQLDRLEKLFSRKKRTVESHEPAATNESAATNRPATPITFRPGFDATTQTFPLPTFIRPTSSRMVAREEVHWSPHSTRRARSLPEPTSAPRLAAPAADDCPPLPARYSAVGHGIPQRSSSIYPASSRDDPCSELLDFSFSTPSRSDDDSSPGRRSRANSKSLTRPSSVSVSPKARADRKRYSAGSQHQLPLQQEIGLLHESAQRYSSSDLAPLQRESKCLGAASREHRALSPSPMLASLARTKPDESSSDKSKASRRPRSLSISRTDIMHASEALRKATSLSQLQTEKAASLDPILKEPSVTDFLALSDEDIADGQAALRAQRPASKPPTSALPPNPPASTPARTMPAYPMLTLSPPLASRPAASAAIEAARIATKYRFDLVYVVNLWPSHMSRLSRSSPLSQSCGTPVATSPARTTTTPSPPASPASNASRHDSGFASGTPPPPRDSPRGGGSGSGGVTGRLLAAYGLSSIVYPFRISAPVHQEVLRTEGWLEYRNARTGATDELARGYSCSFYTGHSPARGRQTTAAAAAADASPTDNTKRARNKAKPANRGIVFAAFRLPSQDGTPIASDAAELEELHQDAEALVDMLIEIHMAQRQTAPRRCAAGGAGSRLAKPGAAVAPMVAI